MQKCPFCEFSYGEMTLNDGRCPQCGSIIEWPDDSVPSGQMTTTPFIVPPFTPAPPIPANNEIGNQKSEGQSPFVDEGQTPQETDSAQIEKLWRDSIVSNSDVYCTLKGDKAEATVSDSAISIQRRGIREPNSPDLPTADYEILEKIGTGGVGVVYSARQASIDRTVAIKMLRQEYSSRAEHQDKFLAEAVLTGELDHPNIVPIYDLGRSNSGELFYSMKNVVGTPWDRVISTKSLRENLDILMKVSDAVGFAHSRGIIHRDLKPENVMLGNFGEVLVMDWGIAMPTEGFRKSSSIRRSQAMGGTPAYMAPEMAKGPFEDIGMAADVYLLGGILFEILCGFPPHHGTDVMDCVRNAGKNIIQPTEVSGELMEIAIKALATLPRRRFRSVQNFQDSIRLYQSHIESLTLSDNAESDLNNALVSKDYKDFSRAVFALEKAISLWPENSLAEDGLLRAKTEYAKVSLDKGDYDLGLSMLDSGNHLHQPIIKKLRNAQKERDARQSRLKWIRRLAIALMGFIFIAGSIAMTFILQLNQEAKTQRDLAKDEKIDADKQRDKAMESEDEAKKQTTKAENQRAIAEVRRQEAEEARLDSVKQKQKAEESSFLAETGLVGASIEQNRFAIAAELLNDQETNPAKSKLRHWEWGRFRFLEHGGRAEDPSQAVSVFRRKASVKTVRTFQKDLTNGECELWQRGRSEFTHSFRHGKTINDVDVALSGTFITTCGMDDDGTYSVRVWQFQGENPPTAVTNIGSTKSSLETVAFSNDENASYISAGGKQGIGRVWEWRSGKKIAILLGHSEPITCTAFSPDSQFVVTASLDGTARLWRTKTGKEVQKFSEHRGPVNTVAFDPSGTQIASAGADRRVLLWNVDPPADPNQEIADIERLIKGEKVIPPTVRILGGLNANIQEIQFSRDGKQLVSAGNDNVVTVWSIAKAIANDANDAVVKSQTLRGHGDWIRSVCFSDDGTEVLSGGDDLTWRSWRLADYREKLILGDGQGSILDAEFTKDGGSIATAMKDGSIDLWDCRSGKSIASLTQGHDYFTNRAMFASNGRQLITAAYDNTLRIWDVERGTEVAKLEHTGRNAVASLSRNGRWLVASGDELGIGVWDLERQGETELIRLGGWKKSDAAIDPSKKKSEPRAVAISDDGQRVLAADKNGTCKFWDVQQGRLLQSIPGHSESVVAAFFLPSDGTKTNEPGTAITVSTDSTVAWWDADNGKELPKERIRHFAPVRHAAISKDGNYLACSAALNQGASKHWIWNLKTGENVATKELQGEFIQYIAFAKDSDPSVLITTAGLEDSRKKIWRWTPDNNQFLETGSPSMKSSSLWGTIANSDGSKLLTFGGRGARLWQTNTNTEEMNYRPSSAVRAIGMSNDGRFLASGSDDGAAVIWNLHTRTAERKLPSEHVDRILDVAFSPDNTLLATTGADGRILIWDLTSGNVAVRGSVSGSESNKSVGNSIQFSPDGKAVVVAAEDDLVRIYESKTLQLLKPLKGHTAGATCASYSWDGRWIVTGSRDKTIRVWSVESGGEIATLKGHSAALESVCFSNDGFRILSSSQDTTTKLWDASLIVKLPDDKPIPQGYKVEENPRETISLEFRSSETIAAAFSPDGFNLMTAGLDGFAVVWPAERVLPAVRLSAPSITYEIGKAPIAIDPAAVLSQPGTFDLAGMKLTISAMDSFDQDESLILDESDGRFSVKNDMVWFHADAEKSVAIGSLKAASDDEIVLEFNNDATRKVAQLLWLEFNNEATHNVAQLLLRHIVYAKKRMDPQAESLERTLVIELVNREGKSGNAVPESLSIRFTQMPTTVAEANLEATGEN